MQYGQNYDDGTCIHADVETIHDLYHQKPASEPASKNFTEGFAQYAFVSFVFLICHCFVSEDSNFSKYSHETEL